MKNSIKKGIVAVALASTMAIPMVVSAASSYLTGDYGSYDYNLHYAWADHEHYMVSAEIHKGGYNASQSGWGHARTKAIYGGTHGTFSYSDGRKTVNDSF